MGFFSKAAGFLSNLVGLKSTTRKYSSLAYECEQKISSVKESYDAVVATLAKYDSLSIEQKRASPTWDRQLTAEEARRSVWAHLDYVYRTRDPQKGEERPLSEKLVKLVDASRNLPKKDKNTLSRKTSALLLNRSFNDLDSKISYRILHNHARIADETYDHLQSYLENGVLTGGYATIAELTDTFESTLARLERADVKKNLASEVIQYRESLNLLKKAVSVA